MGGAKNVVGFYSILLPSFCVTALEKILEAGNIISC